MSPVRPAENFSAKERVLVVEVNWLGDVLFSTPALRAVRKRHPGAYIAALVVPRCKGVLLGNNYLDEVMVLDEQGRYRGWRGKLRLIRDLRVRRFGIAYLFHRSFTRALCVFLAGIPRRIGYDTKKRGFLLTERVAPPPADFHRADTTYYLVTKNAMPDSERYCDFFFGADDKTYVEDFLKKHNLGLGKKLVVLHVGGNWDLKRWPKEHFARLSDALDRDYGADVVITGSLDDYSIADKIAAGASRRPFVACGLTTLKQLGALFQRCDLVVSADSGPLHIAVAVGAHTLALFGPTSPEITGPFGRGDFAVVRKADLTCEVPCYHLGCPDNTCMSSIHAEDVLSEAERRGWIKRGR